MNAFLSVTHGSAQPAKFLEMYVLCSAPSDPIIVLTAYHSHYNGAPDKDATPIVFVGKGITFDSGGISIKPSAVSLKSTVIERI